MVKPNMNILHKVFPNYERGLITDLISLKRNIFSVPLKPSKAQSIIINKSKYNMKKLSINRNKKDQKTIKSDKKIREA